LPKSTLTSGERLQRQGPVSPGSIANLIVIGASAGGHQALREILKNFSSDMPAAIVILLHMALGSAHNLKALLGQFSRLPIIEIENEEALQQGFIFVPPPGRSAVFSSGVITVERDAPDRPPSTINRLFTSAAQSYGERVIGVILSGLLKDGTNGLRAVHQSGGLTVVQDPEEAEFPEMPTSAMEGLPVTFCLNLADVGPALELLARRTARFETGLAVAVRTLRDRAALLVRLGEQSWRNPGTREFLRNELASLRRDIQSIDQLLKASLDEPALQNDADRALHRTKDVI
jgi:two-component system, chemotaxis family, protein-glutamate methylesterase/glutaminase